MAKRGKASLAICSTAFAGLGRAQAKALGLPALPVALVPHPFGILDRGEIRAIAQRCADEIFRLACEGNGP